MTSRIRVSRDQTVEDTYVVSIQMEADQGAATWVLVDKGESGPSDTVRASGVVSHEKDSPVDEFSDQLPPLEPGAYDLLLVDGRLSKRATRLTGDHAVLDQTSLLVPSGVGTPRIPDPVRVRLVRQENPPKSVDGKKFVTYAEFAETLDAGFADDPAAFGTGNYRDLLEAAREFVRGKMLQKFDELMPPGYEADRKAHEPLLSVRLREQPVLPAVELIWNYFEEEASLVQTLNVILARFQNRRLRGRDPLARFDVTPLLPLRNLLWGFAEGELHRTTVRRRAAEYEYEYGLPLIGRAIPPRGQNVERRSPFLKTFHQVIHEAHVFYKEIDDLTIAADAFPLYQALSDCHLVLSQGSQNQYGEMAVAARAEFLVMQHLLAQPQMREFLGGRPMTPYPEPWMDRVDTMKTIQGWDDATVMHYHDLATIGEQLVLTIRLGNWAAQNVGAAEAQTWATAFRSRLQRYAAAYRSVTGVDLSRTVNAEFPSTLIARKLGGQRRRA